MKILVLGDVHGNFYDVEFILAQAVSKFGIDMCIQVGDFGFYPRTFASYSKKFQVPLFAIDGNHEDHDWLKKNVQINDWKETRNLTYIPRGTTWELDDLKIGFLGGACNVDRAQEGSTKRKTTNYPLNSEILDAIKKFNDLGQLDILITHSCPHSIGVGMHGHPVFLESVEKYITRPLGVSTGPLHDCGEETLRVLWNGLKIKPKQWIFGHFHCYHQKQVQNTMFTCVGAGDSAGGHDFTIPFILDTKAGTFEAFPKDKLLNAYGILKQVELREEIPKT